MAKGHKFTKCIIVRHGYVSDYPFIVECIGYRKFEVIIFFYGFDILKDLYYAMCENQIKEIPEIISKSVEKYNKDFNTNYNLYE